MSPGQMFPGQMSLWQLEYADIEFVWWVVVDGGGGGGGGGGGVKSFSCQTQLGLC